MRMWGWLMYTLLLALSVLASTFSQLQEEKKSVNEYINQAVELFNEDENIQFKFKPLDDQPATFMLADENTQMILFKIKQTVCEKSQKESNLECDFKPDGEIRLCISYAEDQENADNIICDTIFQDFRTKRSARRRKKCKTFFCKLLQKFQGSKGSGSKRPEGGQPIFH
ncbi:cathelicidin-6-like [Bombina bombina]|uniref:cathelicidin-6-like n=1 Tax=Bombina bombina TaxID=8345 RepID=UPI00235A6AE3|nr:cathelicidin-6-like [Bombina bombina]